MKAKVGKTYLTEIPHEGGSLTFQYPAFSGTYRDVAKAIDKEGLRRPNSSETASLIYDAFQNKKEKYESEIIKILHDAWFWEFTINHYLPKSNEEVNNGVILEYNPKIENGKLVMDKNSLIKRLKENDSSVKFIPFGYKTGEQNASELRKNPYLIARYGREGAEKIGEIAAQHYSRPKLWSFDSVDKEKVRVSILGRAGSYWLDVRLNVTGNITDDQGIGHSFGVCAD